MKERLLAAHCTFDKDVNDDASSVYQTHTSHAAYKLEVLVQGYRQNALCDSLASCASMSRVGGK